MSTKKKETKKKQPERVETIEAKHEFDQTERIALLDELSRANREVDSLGEQKKMSNGDWSNRIKTTQLKVQQLSEKAQAGYEMRPVVCRVVYDPARRKKTYFEKEGGKELETRDMTESDFQLDLFLDQPINSMADAFPSE